MFSKLKINHHSVVLIFIMALAVNPLHCIQEDSFFLNEYVELSAILEDSKSSHLITSGLILTTVEYQPIIGHSRWHSIETQTSETSVLDTIFSTPLRC